MIEVWLPSLTVGVVAVVGYGFTYVMARDQRVAEKVREKERRRIADHLMSIQPIDDAVLEAEKTIVEVVRLSITLHLGSSDSWKARTAATTAMREFNELSVTADACMKALGIDNNWIDELSEALVATNASLEKKEMVNTQIITDITSQIRKEILKLKEDL